MASSGLTKAAITAMMISATLKGAAAEGPGDNCSKPTESAKYAAELIQEAQAATADDSTTRRDKLRTQIFKETTTNNQDRVAAVALVNLLSRCEKARRHTGISSRTQATGLAIKLVHAFGVAEALGELKEAAIKGESRMTPISGSPQYKKIELETTKTGIPQGHCNLHELLQDKAKLISNPLEKTKILDQKELQQVATGAGDGADVAMCCAANTGSSMCTSGGQDDLGIKGHGLFTTKAANKGKSKNNWPKTTGQT
uniref:Variant surface glycoprotein 1983 n=1 Tax=Trypanosoma brucei TaxID=5691 RepID=M4SZS1_9TRYP|nr:variant surface glycoprotein 1983 [Trypanosoma brucei]